MYTCVFTIKLAAVAAELPMQTDMHGRCTVRNTSVVEETQDVDAYFFVFFGMKKGFVHGGDVEGASRPFPKVIICYNVLNFIII